MRATKQAPHSKLLFCIIFSLSFFYFFNLLPRMAYSWGFYAHKKINSEAVYALPAPLNTFYEKYSGDIELHAADPDKRRYVDSTEAPHHFIDIDHYGGRAIDEIPRYWTAAVKKYSADTLNRYGTLPWSVLQWEEKLTLAFKKMDAAEILKASSYLGHYVADAHVPLHTVTNYNGQKTEQQGIHALWESFIPQNFGSSYQYAGIKAVYIKDPEAKIWEIIRHSYLLAPSVLQAERETRTAFKGRDIYLDTLHKKFTPAYIDAFNNALNGMVEKQIESSVADVASFWYTAWVNSGQPDPANIK
ncbi:MAG: S1/P1 Nuclease [Bacteroidia bacterium]|nr:S1/P1 Nuclease [Bacteroidia bacterium]